MFRNTAPGKGIRQGRLKNACVRASAFQQYSYLVLESILKQNLDGGLVAESVCATGNDIHENLRGAGYYQ